MSCFSKTAATTSRSGVPFKRMRNLGRQVGKAALIQREGLLADPDLEAPRQDVDRLLLLVVHVQRRPAFRRDSDGEYLQMSSSSGSKPGVGLDLDGAPEPNPFTAGEFSAWRDMLRVHASISRELDRALLAEPPPPSGCTGHPPRRRPQAAVRPPERARSETPGRAVGESNARRGLQSRLAPVSSTGAACRSDTE
jgi:hypothetical protein